MMMINHMVTGAVIAFTVKEPLLALPLAVLSHFVLDSIPHFGDNNQGVSKEGYFPRFKKAVLITDAAFTVIFMSWLVVSGYTLAIAVAVAAASPDFVWIYREIVLKIRGSLKPRNVISKFHETVQWYEKRWAIIIDVAYLAFMLRVLAL